MIGSTPVSCRRVVLSAVSLPVAGAVLDVGRDGSGAGGCANSTTGPYPTGSMLS